MRIRNLFFLTNDASAPLGKVSVRDSSRVSSASYKGREKPLSRPWLRTHSRIQLCASAHRTLRGPASDSARIRRADASDSARGRTGFGVDRGARRWIVGTRPRSGAYRTLRRVIPARIGLCAGAGRSRRDVSGRLPGLCPDRPVQTGPGMRELPGKLADPLGLRGAESRQIGWRQELYSRLEAVADARGPRERVFPSLPRSGGRALGAGHVRARGQDRSDP